MKPGDANKRIQAEALRGRLMRSVGHQKGSVYERFSFLSRSISI
jgi:hypothetical protein